MGGWVGFALQICAGAATVLWPNEKWLAWSIFIAGTALLLASLAWWFFANYRIQRKGASADVGAQWSVPPAESLSGRRYVNEHIEIDGKSFEHCHFTNVSLLFHGRAPFQFLECRLDGEVIFLTDHPAVKSALSYGNMVRHMVVNAPAGVKSSSGFGVKDNRGNIQVTWYDQKGGEAPAPAASTPKPE